jgi:SlyX protein
MMTEDLISRIDRLEILFTEQEFTVESLNTVITRQAQDIDQLTNKIDLLKQQIKDLKKQIPETTIVDEKPPHY